ncbi:MAG: hydrogen gas-evolving membrane-bound hydrogenase subunit E [Pseudomonadota bacterium]
MAAAAEGPGSPAQAAAGWALALLSAAAAVMFARLLPITQAGGAATASWEWVPSLGVSLAFRIDGLSLVFALLITVFGAAIALYSTRYLRGHRHLGRFFLYLGLFEAGMVGLVTADDLITMFVFWEVTTISSYLLVGFDHASAKARRSAWMALLITGAGGLALLAGLVLLGMAAGTTRISEITAGGRLIDHALYTPIFVLVILGAFAKSAQAPLHIWLPNAMAAPTPVSAYLHSATMVKAGVYLLARLHPALAGSEMWTFTLGAFGGTTMLMASVLALRQTDLKLALAYTSVMALGALMMFLGATEEVAVVAAMTFLIVHALYKASLFLITGAIDHSAGTREIPELGGLWRTMPVTSLAGVLAVGSMAGFPPFLGFVGKELKYEGALAIAEEPLALAGAAVLSNAMMVALALKILFKIILGTPTPKAMAASEAPPRLWAGPLLLASLGLVCGVAPDLVGSTLVIPAAEAVLAEPAEIKLKLWHGVNVPLLMSITTVALGLIGYLVYRRLSDWLQIIPEAAEGIWDAILDAIAGSFEAVAAVMQNGSLRTYLSVTFAVAAIAPLAALLAHGGLARPETPMDAPTLGAAALTVVGALAAASARRRMLAIGGIGAVGSGIALLFVIKGAPDVAITQLLVDVLLILLICAVTLKVPELKPRREGRLRDGVIAGAAGLCFAALTLAVTAGPLDLTVARTMEMLSVPEAKGRNIVNVVLVDFRAIDTFGEVVVVAAAAVGALALIRMKAFARAGARPQARRPVEAAREAAE